MKYILAILLTLLALTATASSLNLLRKEVKDPDLLAGIVIPKTDSVADFSNLIIPDTPYKDIPTLSAEANGYMEPYASWYNMDFSNDPFDGLVDILVMGEPLPSPAATLMIVLVVGGIIYCTRKQPVVV